jgi:hypothetical protein
LTSFRSDAGARRLTTRAGGVSERRRAAIYLSIYLYYKGAKEMKISCHPHISYSPYFYPSHLH